MTASARAIAETVAFEAVCLGICVALWEYAMPVVDHSGWMIVVIMLIGAAPAPLFLGLRYPALSSGGTLRLISVAAISGIAITAATTAASFALEQSSPCPETAFECSDYLFTFLVAGYCLFIVMPALIVLTPLARSAGRTRLTR